MSRASHEDRDAVVQASLEGVPGECPVGASDPAEMIFLSWSCSLRYFHIWWNQLILHPPHCVLLIVEGGDADGDLGVSGFEVVQHCMKLIHPLTKWPFSVLSLQLFYRLC